jgi:hypothetical protein
MGTTVLGGAAGLALILAFALMVPGTATVTGPIGHDDPPASDSLPPPPNPYPCFPGEGRHLGFGNGFGHAGFKFRCL